MKRLLRFLGLLLVGLVGFSLIWTLAYRWIDPPVTYLMMRDRFRGIDVQHQWVPLSGMSRSLPRAVIGAEDAHFCTHSGFDMDAMEKAYEANQKGRKLRGGSTISQQTAKNVFLWPGRTMVRKGVEAWFTLLIEWMWGKPRIMEVYLNVAELGPGIYGVEAAAQHYFHKSAAQLSPVETARLAAILPQPIKRNAASPGRYTRRYANRIVKRARVVANEGIDACIWRK